MVGRFTRGRARLSDDDGFTIIEVLIAAFILVMGALAVFMTFAAAIHNVQRGRETQQGISVAQREVEHLRVLPFQNLGVSGGSMTPSPSSSGLPTARVSTGGNLFDVARPTSTTENKQIVPGSISPTPIRVSSPDGTKVRVYRFVVCEEELPPGQLGECDAKRIVVDVMPISADNQAGYTHSYYELQSTVVKGET